MGPSADAVMQLLAGHMTAKFVFVATELGVFEILADGACDRRELQRRLDVPDHSLRILLDALVAVGFLARTDDRYSNNEVSQEFLSGRGHQDLRPILRMWDQVVYQ